MHTPWIRRVLPALCLLITSPFLAAESIAPPPLPEAISNHPFTRLEEPDGELWATLSGLGAGKTWRDLRATGYWWRQGMPAWQALPPLPGSRGRLAAQLVAASGSLWFFGGYTVAPDGTEVSTPDVYRVAPLKKPVYQAQAAMPVPVDDAVALVYQDRYIYLISGWHDVGNVNLVQIFDTQDRLWIQAEPWPGIPVFGHAGGITGSSLLVCGGARVHYPPSGSRQFLMSEDCWGGRIRADDPRRIDWYPVAPMPGGARYRAAAIGMSYAASDWVFFLGGTLNPYNYDGIGYDGEPSIPLASVLGYDLKRQQWQCFAPLETATMDHRSAVLTMSQSVALLGGMDSERRVSAALQTWQPRASDCSLPITDE